MSPTQASQSPQTLALAQRVARSIWLRSWGRMLLWVLPYAMGIALVLVIGIRWWMGIDWWWGIPIGVIALVIVSTSVVAWMKRPGPMFAAGWLDEAAHTQSRYRSAIELIASSNADPAFAAIAVERAEQSAIGVEMPTDNNKPWHEQALVYTTATLLVMIVVAGLYMPVRTPTSPSDDLPSPVAIADAREQISTQQEELEELVEESAEEDPLIADALKDLEALQEELTTPELSPDPESAAAIAQSRIEQLADDLDERSEQQRLDEQALREHLDDLKSESLSDESELERFREQLSEGRYEEAIEELDALDDALDSMTDEQREQAAEDLDSLADAIEPENTPQQEDQPGSTDEDEQTDPVDAEKLSEALKDRAEQIREHEPEPSQDQDQQNQSEQSEQNQDSSDQSKQQDASESDPQEQEGKKQSQRESQDQSQEKTDQKESDQGEPREQSEGEQPESEQQNQSTQDPDPTGDQQQEQPQPSDQPEGGNDQTREQDQQQNPEEGTEPGSEQQQPEPGEQPSEGEGEGKSTLKEMLEEAQRQAEGAEQDRTMAERLREQIDQSQDDQQQQPGLEPSTNPEDKQGAGPGDQDEFVPDVDPVEQPSNQEYVPVQASDEQAQADDSSTPIGKWYNPDADDPLPSGQSQTAERFHNAAKKAREQVEDRRVPRRYRDVIREYFKQLDQRAAKLTPSSDGADAPEPSKESE